MFNMRPFTIRMPALVFGLVSAAGFSSLTSAAPQILAIASTDLPVPLLCEKGECTAELTAICLQEHRASPQMGTAYYLHESRKLALSLTDSKGGKIDISSLPYEIKAARGHSAVRISIKETRLRDLDYKQLSVSVPEGATAIPVPVANDTKPQTESDILIATGSLRPLASRMVDGNTDRADAARLVNLALNSLPSRGRAEPAQRKSATLYFDKTATASGYSSQAVSLARKALKQCDYETQVGFWSLRQCLGSSHDQLIGKLNTKYWRSLNSGS